jgi:4-aminobutyrate aminotransferase-like enzyme
VTFSAATLAAAELLRRYEAPGVNTLWDDQPSMVWQSAKGSWVTDLDGRRLLDFTSGFGVAALGHRPGFVLTAVRRQLGVLLHGLGDVAAHPTRIAAAHLLANAAPRQPAQVYWAVSGADAIEIALKTARLATSRKTVITFDAGYHGLTAGALATTARERFRAPFAAHLDPYIERLPWGADLALVDRALERNSVAAVLAEPIPGREGVEVAPPGWLAELAGRAAQAGALFIADEVLTGGGRTGSFWASTTEGVAPDLVCFGKAIGGGLPLAGVLGSPQTFAAWPKTGEALHTATFLAHPLACAAALATVPRLAEPRLHARVRRLGDHLQTRLEPACETCDLGPLPLRGRGLMWAIELPTAGAASNLALRARLRGLLLLAGGRRGRTVQLLPPLSISRSDLDLALDLLVELLGSSPLSR